MKQMLHDSIWRHHDLRIMLPARALSQFGDDLVLIVLMLRVFGAGHGPWSVTGLLLCSTVPVVVLAPVAGRLVDALPFKPLAIAVGLWQAGCCLGVAAVDPLWAVYGLVVLLQAGQVVSDPVWRAMVPSIAEPDEIGGVMGAGQALATLAAVGAPAIAGLLVATVGYGAPFVIDAATFCGLALAATAIRASRQTATAEQPEETPGFSVWRDPLLRPLILGVCALVVAGEMTNVVEVFLVRGTLGATTFAFGLVGAALAGGIVVGSMLAGRHVPDSTRGPRTALAAIALGLTIVLAGLAPDIWVFAGAWALLGVANGFANVDGSTLLLNRAPASHRGRVLATVNGMVRGSSLAAMLLGGLGGTLLGPRATFVVAGTLMAVAAVALLVRLTRTLSAGSARSAATPSAPPSEAGRPA
jgi:MFS family permease